MNQSQKTPWHEKTPVRMTLWLVIAATACGAFYLFNNVATKNMAARNNTPPPPSSTSATAAATPSP
jgi:hypothetical protein